MGWVGFISLVGLVGLDRLIKSLDEVGWIRAGFPPLTGRGEFGLHY